MRNRILSAGLSFIALSAALFLSGCSQSYDGEKFFWKAQKIAGPVMKNPSKASPEQFTKAIDAYNEVITKLPGTEWAGRAQLSIGALYQYQKKSQQAREKYRLVLQDYHRFQQLCVSARMAIAKSHEADKNWPEAVKAYKDLSEYHSWTRQGLQAPLYIAASYEKRKDAGEALRSYESAVSWYKKLILNAPSRDLEATVKVYLSAAYQQLNQWNDAAATLEQVTDAQGIDKPFVLMNLGQIYQKHLQSPEKAQAMFQKVVRDYPKHPYAKLAKEQIDRMNGISPAAIAPAAKAP